LKRRNAMRMVAALLPQPENRFCRSHLIAA
jgi:hypothetical protein